MTYTKTFNCRDFSGWFLRCLKDNGVDGTGLSMWCKDCNKVGETFAHRVVVYPRDGKYCPAEPQLASGEATACCKATIAEAEQCAHDLFCAGKFPARATPHPDYAGCKPGTRSQQTCATCMAEPCTAEERKAVCKLLNVDDSCGAKTTNTACTQCCIDKFGNNNNNPALTHCLSTSNCGGKP